MSKNELGLQTDILNSAKADKGYGFKLSNRFSIGIPDLYLFYPEFAPLLVEVKDLGELSAPFERKVATTPKQRSTMNKVNNVEGVYGEFAIVMIGYKIDRVSYLTALHHDATLVTDNHIRVIRQRGRYYPLKTLLDAVGAAQMETYT